MKTGNSLTNISFSPRISRKSQQNLTKLQVILLKTRENLAKNYQTIAENLTATVFTTTVFLGGSYLFLIKLAEYGW